MMPKLHVVPGGLEPVTPAAGVRKRIAQGKQRDMPQCPRDNSREFIVARIGKVQTKICVLCLTNGHRTVMRD